MTRRQLATYALIVNCLCLAIMIVLTVARGWPIVAFALGGFLLSAAYTAPPLRLKKHGLGEPTVLVVWGPLMVGGTYYAATGQIPGAIVLASLPYALLCTTVLMGKHIDKIPWDGPDGTHTLPVILGEARARARHEGHVRRLLRLDRRARDRAGAAGRLALVFASLPIMVRTWKAYSRAEARGLAGTEPGVAAVVRGDVVPRDPPGGRVVRARVDRGRHPRLVSVGAVTRPQSSIYAPAMTPSTMQDFPLTITAILRHGRRVYADSECVTWTDDGARRATFAEVADNADRLAAALTKLGVRDGDRVGTFCWNTQEHLEAYFAIPCLGAVLHTLNIRLFPEQLAYVINHARGQGRDRRRLAGAGARARRRRVADRRAVHRRRRRRRIRAR